MSCTHSTKALWKLADDKESGIKSSHWGHHLPFKFLKMKLGPAFVWLSHFRPPAGRLLPALPFLKKQGFSDCNWQWLLTHPAGSALRPCRCTGPRQNSSLSSALLPASDDILSTTCLSVPPLFKLKPLEDKARPGHLGWVALCPPSQHSVWPWHQHSTCWLTERTRLMTPSSRPFSAPPSEASFSWVASGRGRGLDYKANITNSHFNITCQNPLIAHDIE